MSFKENTYKLLYEYYEQNGFDKFMTLARDMLEAKTHKDNKVFHSHVHGEICETVAVVTIKEFMRKNPEDTKDWFITKGTILRDPTNSRKNYFTELDVTLFTPSMIFALECKSYGGDKKIQDVCTINRRGRKTDVFDQHKKHVETLIKNIDAARVSKESTGYQLILFNFSLGKVEDLRTPRDKLFMLALDEKTLPNLLELSLGKEPVWDIHLLKRMMSIIERKKKQYASEHLKYVRGLHKK